jgi:hypothetical protein
MYFTDFPEANFTFTKPENMRDDQCGTLRVQRGLADVGGEKFPVSISAWKPEPEDIERINNGGLIYLNIFGNGHPMVSVSTEKREVEPIVS